MPRAELARAVRTCGLCAAWNVAFSCHTAPGLRGGPQGVRDPGTEGHSPTHAQHGALGNTHRQRPLLLLRCQLLGFCDDPNSSLELARGKKNRLGFLIIIFVYPVKSLLSLPLLV